VNLAGLIEDHPADARALYDGVRWHTWGNLRRRVAATATGLTGVGVGPDDRVVVAWPTSVDFVVAYLAVLAAGGVAVPLNPNSPAAELARELDAVTPAVVLAGGAAARAMVDAAGATTTAPRFVVPADIAPPDAAAGSDAGDVVSWEELSAAAADGTGVAGAGDGTGDGAPVTFRVADRGDDDLAVLLFTSGTAGVPRPAMLTHGNLIANLRQMLALPGEIVRADDVGLGAVPLFHVFGLNVALGLSIATGAALVLEERFDAAVSLGLARRLGVTNLVGVPTMFAAWADVAAGDPDAAAALGGVRRAISGAAALPAAVAERFERAFGVPVWQGYGLTEAAPAVSTSLGTGRNRPGSVGLPLPGVSVRLVDESGEDVLAGDPGEIWVKGPNVFPGYWQDPDATAEVLTPNRWLRTGDVGVMGEEGDLFIVDRKKDLVIVSGFNVYPAEVEAVVAGMPEVADAVVVGRPAADSGEEVEVVVVVAPGARLTEEDVRRYCGARLARYKCPATVRFVAELPRGLAGKALRRALRAQAG
jgi:long-chain acyl-CoA synthetase